MELHNKSVTPTLQFKREAQGVFDLGHRGSGQLAQFAFEPGFDQRPNTLDVDHGCLMQKGKVAELNFVPTAPMLRGQREVCEECAGSVRIEARNDENGAGLAANPRSANQMSPGLAFIEGIEHFLHDSSRRLQIQGVGVGQFDYISHDLLDLGRNLRPPGSKLFVEFLGELGHAVTVPRFTLPRKISPSAIGSETRQGSQVIKQLKYRSPAG